MTRFGVELEWERNALALVEWLHDANPDVMGCDSIHGYHCGCEFCDLSYPLKANRDSSCDGEIISKVFLDMDEARPVFELLQRGAVAVDAEPGYSSGLHVHIDAGYIPSQHRRRAFAEFLRWTYVFSSLAAGRFEYLRDNNANPLDSASSVLRGVPGPWTEMDREIYDVERDEYVPNPDWKPPRGRWNIADAVQAVSRMSDTDRDTWAGLLLDHNSRSDRHSYLCTNTRYGTWEFRIFNSTRSAWRMELFCEMARAWASPEFVEHLRTYTDNPTVEVTDRAVDHFIEALGVYDSHVGELALKQNAYRKSTNFVTLPDFTVV